MKIYTTIPEKGQLEDVAMVCDMDGNELAIGDTVGACQAWCKKNNITGSEGEYIRLGTIIDRYFEWDGDIENIDANYEPWGELIYI